MPILKSILLVDDDKVTNYLHKVLLQQLKLADNIEIRQNGREALDLIEEKLAAGQHFELILLDIKMPVLDGFEFLDQAKKLKDFNPEKSRIVMLSTSTNPKDIEKIKEAGITDYLNKPLSPEKVQDILRKHFKFPEIA
jgi:CheY-like chemotaxis protein